LKFYSSVRLDIRRIATLKDSQGESIGIRARVKVVKNKVAAPFKIAEFDIMYDEGISSEGALLDVAVDKEIVSKRGAWFSWGETRLGQGRDAVKELLKNDPELCKKLDIVVKEKIGYIKTENKETPDETKETDVEL